MARPVLGAEPLFPKESPCGALVSLPECPGLGIWESTIGSLDFRILGPRGGIGSLEFRILGLRGGIGSLDSRILGLSGSEIENGRSGPSDVFGAPGRARVPGFSDSRGFQDGVGILDSRTLVGSTGAMGILGSKPEIGRSGSSDVFGAPGGGSGSWILGF